MQISLRPETPADHRKVEELTREAFWNVHVPGCDEHYLAHVLRASEAFIPGLDFVALADGQLAGNIMFTRAVVCDTEGIAHPVLCFGPVSVLPALQGKGIGSALIRHTLNLAREMGHSAVVIYGDPDYYIRFGFFPAERHGITTRDGKFCPALLACELKEKALSGITGRFLEDRIYDLDKAEAERFDLTFPPKTKGYSPTQERFKALSS